MNEWHEAELQALRTRWPGLDFREAGLWILVSSFKIAEGWNKSEINLGVRLPENLPGQEPYGFWVQDGILLADGQTPSNYTFPSETLPFTNDNQWGQFSWSFDGWQPGATPGTGMGMVHFIHSISHRFEELN